MFHILIRSLQSVQTCIQTLDICKHLIIPYRKQRLEESNQLQKGLWCGVVEASLLLHVLL